MRMLAVCAAVVASVFVLFAVGCGDPNDGLTASTLTTTTTETSLLNPEAAPEIRTELESIRRFVTENEGYDVGHRVSADGQGAADMVLGSLSLYFRDGEIHYQVSDHWDQCTYQVDDEGHIQATDYFGARLEGRYDRDSGRLEWGGRWYVAD